ncbi:MAG: hypothetical protein IT371_16970 [Deltaproteobacteria bacterium]|nr:hypothetical protein [Deltaproteobacteria bacterium]
MRLRRGTVVLGVVLGAWGCSTGKVNPTPGDDGAVDAAFDGGAFLDGRSDAGADATDGALFDGALPDSLVADQRPPDSPPPVARCATAQVVSLATGSATVQGSTVALLDEFPQLRCGGTTALVGPQAYYRVSLFAGQNYRVRLSPSFAAVAYLFPAAAGCVAAEVEKGCASGGKTGAVSPVVASGKSHTLTFTPAQDGDFIVGVDSEEAGAAGAFTLAVELDCTRFADVCHDGAVNAGRCVAQAKTGPCSDGNACTEGDTCKAGQCLGTPKNCSSVADSCNAGVCQGGSCVKQPKPGSCDDGNPCTTADACVGGVCRGTPPTDAYEPNDNYLGARLTGTTDCSNLDHSLTAVLYPASDLDWYWFDVKDGALLCDVQPRVTLSVPTGSNYDLCVFFTCNNGATVSLTCNAGNLVPGPTPASKGCCSTNAGSTAESVQLSPSCGGGDTSGFADVRVFAPTTSSGCGRYTLQWGDS